MAVGSEASGPDYKFIQAMAGNQLMPLVWSLDFPGGSSMSTAAGMLVYDASNGFCARRIDVLVPDTWDRNRILKESRKRLPKKMTMVEPVPESIMIYPADADPYFADWRDPQASLF